jgi:hypothetical protein
MRTAVFEVAMTLSSRIAEIDRIIALADKSTSDEKLYNTLCRASCVLLASHLEGFMKDLSKSLIADLNYHLKAFSKMPEAVKNTFCQKIAFYEGVKADEITARTKQLISFFDNNTVAVDLHAFTYKETQNKNPSGDMIDGTLAKLGIPNALYSISGGKIENIFKNDPSWNYLIRREFRGFRSRLYSFPYKKLPPKYEFKYRAPKADLPKIGKTMWHDFVSEIMGRRHTIAHGDTINSVATTAQLRQDAERLDVLMHGLLYSSAGFIVKE